MGCGGTCDSLLGRPELTFAHLIGIQGQSNNSTKARLGELESLPEVTHRTMGDPKAAAPPKACLNMSDSEPATLELSV